MAEPTPAQPQHILALVDDLFFMLKIEDTAKHLSWPIQFASTVLELLEHLKEARPTLLIVDLTLGGEDLASFFEQIHASPGQPPSPILGYTTHADWKRTTPLHAMCTKVVTKDALSRHLPTLMQQLIRRDDA